MNPALWVLIGLHLRSWLRYPFRNLNTAKGAVLNLVGVVFFVGWLCLLLFMPEGPGFDRDSALQAGPALLLVFCLFNVLSSSDDRAIYFTPAEVNFLFTGPFGRRELLVYKIVFAAIISLPSSLILSCLRGVHGAWVPAVFVGLVLIFLFMQLFAMAVSLAVSAVGARLFSRGRQLLFAAAVGLVAVVAWQAGAFGGDPSSLPARLTQTQAWQIASQPLRWFFEAMWARDLWPDLAWFGFLGLLVDLALAGVVIALDAHFLEASASASARLHAQRQQRRRGGALSAGKPRYSLPMFPWWGGAGPIFWRQLTGALRGSARLLVRLGIIGLLFLGVMVPAALKQNEETAPALSIAATILFGTVFLTTLAPFDFRGDVDHIALLKTLPLPAWRLTVGQLLAPTLVFTLLQWSALAAVQYLLGPPAPWLLLFAAFAPPFNFLLFGLENLLFLLFPTRMLVATPGDFQAMGRSVLFQVIKFVCLCTAGVASIVVGAVVYFLTGGNLWAGAAAAWLPAAGFAAALVPLTALAFGMFDVSRETPA